MERLDVQKAYDEILADSRRMGEISDVFSGTERRQYPRFQLHSDDVWISSVPEYVLIDMSASGIAFSSNYPLPRGENIKISVGSVVSVNAEVVGCELIETATLYYGPEFRIKCQFADYTTGMELLVRAKRLEQKEGQTI